MKGKGRLSKVPRTKKAREPLQQVSKETAQGKCRELPTNWRHADRDSTEAGLHYPSRPGLKGRQKGELPFCGGPYSDTCAACLTSDSRALSKLRSEAPAHSVSFGGLAGSMGLFGFSQGPERLVWKSTLTQKKKRALGNLRTSRRPKRQWVQRSSPNKAVKNLKQAKLGPQQGVQGRYAQIRFHVPPQKQPGGWGDFNHRCLPKRIASSKLGQPLF